MCSPGISVTRYIIIIIFYHGCFNYLYIRTPYDFIEEGGILAIRKNLEKFAIKDFGGGYFFLTSYPIEGELLVEVNWENRFV